MKAIKAFFFRKLGRPGEANFKSNVIQFIKFGLVGVSNTLVSWAFYYLFVWINPDLYILGSIIGGVVSIANAFFWNDHFVFKGGNKDFKSKLNRLFKTYLSYGGTSLLGIFLLWFEVEICKMDKNIAPPVNLIITIPLNFIINKFWTFKDKVKNK